MIADESYAGSQSFERFEAKVRAIGSVMFGRTVEARFQPAALELVRLAFPRRVYTQAHFDYILEGIAKLAAGAGKLRGLRLVHEPPLLRHFTGRFAPVA